MPTPDDPRGVEIARGTRPSLRLANPVAASRSRSTVAVAARRINAALILVVTLSLMLATVEGSLASRIAGGAMAAVVFLGAFQSQRRSASFARLSGLAQIVYRLKAVTTGVVGLLAIGALLPGLHLTAGYVLATGIGVALVSACWSVTTRRLLHATPVTRAMFIGDRASTDEFATAFERDPHPEYELAGRLAVSRSPVPAGALPLLGSLDDLETVLAAEAIDVIVLDLDRDRLEVFARLAAIEPLSANVQELAGFSEHVFGRVPVESLNAAWFMHMVHPFYRPYSRVAKRCADLVCASIIALVSLPLVPLAALAVKLSGPGPVLYSQERVGEGGRVFRMFKFRSMVQDAELNGAQWAEEDDPRVTPVGRFMRSTRIDEIPQLWNILIGNMSFVGPRPERPEFVEQLEQQIPYYDRRHQVKPGLTGWAQVRAGYADSIDGALEKLSYELYYLKHRSLLLDLVIFVETVRVVLSRAGAR